MTDTTLVSIKGDSDGTILITTRDGSFRYTDDELSTIYLILSDHLGPIGRLKLRLNKRKYGKIVHNRSG